MNRASSATGWVRNPDGTLGWTGNPITGCNNQVDGMCKGGNFPCYAYRLAHGRLSDRYLSNENIAIPDGHWFKGSHEEQRALLDPFYPRFWMNRVEEADREMSKAKEPMGIFFNDMSDWVGIGVPESWSNWTLELARRHPRHRIYTLTKQPQNLPKWSPFPDNCWVGVTATDTEMLFQACSYLEYPLEARVKYLSIEPFLDWNFNWTQSYLINTLKRANIGWVIIGAQTKPYKPPKIESVKELIQACDKAQIPIFLKNNLRQMYGYLDDIKIRQEMPK